MPWQCYNAGAVALAAHSLGILQDERVPLQQCTSLFAQLLVMLRGACVTCWCYYVMTQSDLSVCAASAAGQTAGVFEVLPGVGKMCHFCPYSHRLHTHATIVLPVVVLTPKKLPTDNDAHPYAAAVRCIEVCSRDWAAAISDVQRRLHQQLLDELAAQGSSGTGELLPEMSLGAQPRCLPLCVCSGQASTTIVCLLLPLAGAVLDGFCYSIFLKILIKGCFTNLKSLSIT